MPTSLSRRVGPLPVWGWLVVGLAAFLVFRRRTEGGWFPQGSVAVESGGGGLVARVGVALGMRREPAPEEEPGGGPFFPPGGGLRTLGRDAQPDPITAPADGGGGETMMFSAMTAETETGPGPTRSSLQASLSEPVPTRREAGVPSGFHIDYRGQVVPNIGERRAAGVLPGFHLNKAGTIVPNRGGRRGR